MHQLVFNKTDSIEDVEVDIAKHIIAMSDILTASDDLLRTHNHK